MSHNLFIGESDKAKSVSKIYLGSSSNIARCVKAVYIGDEDKKARLVWRSGLFKNSTMDSNAGTLRTGRSSLSAGSIGGSAIFAGGETSNSSSNAVDSFDSNLTRTSLTPLSYARKSAISIRLSSYLIFAGNAHSTTYSNSTKVDAYNSRLTRTTATSLPDNGGCGCLFGSNAIFAAFNSSTASTSKGVVKYNTSLTKSNFGTLSTARKNASACSIGNYVLIAGGMQIGRYTADSEVTYKTVDAFNSSGTRISVSDMTSSRCYGIGLNDGTHAVFYLGMKYHAKTSTEAYGSVVYTSDCYDSSLTRTSGKSSTIYCCSAYTAAANNGLPNYIIVGKNNEYGVFCGGDNSTGNFIKLSKLSDMSTRSSMFSMTDGTLYSSCAMAIAGNYLIMAGGYNNGVYSNKVHIAEFENFPPYIT